MTKDEVKTKMMLYYKKQTADKHLRQVFDAVWELGKSAIQRIKVYLDNKAMEEAISRYENGPIDKHRSSELIEENKISKKTIHRKLNELILLGLVEHIGLEYFVSDAWIGDLRYFVDEKAQEFGQGLLGRLTQQHYPTINTFEVNIKKLVEVLGFFMLYCLSESCRPVPFNSRYNRASTPNLFNDKLAIKWSSNVFDSVYILDMFISAISNQISDKELEKIKNGKLKPNASGDPISEGFFPEGPPSTAYFHRKRFLELYSGKGHKQYYDDKKTNAMYQLSEQTYTRILTMLKKLYPDFYQAAIFSREDFFSRPKEYSLKNRYLKKMPREVGKG